MTESNLSTGQNQGPSTYLEQDATTYSGISDVMLETLKSERWEPDTHKFVFHVPKLIGSSLFCLYAIASWRRNPSQLRMVDDAEADNGRPLTENYLSMYANTGGTDALFDIREATRRSPTPSLHLALKQIISGECAQYSNSTEFRTTFLHLLNDSKLLYDEAYWRGTLTSILLSHLVRSNRQYATDGVKTVDEQYVNFRLDDAVREKYEQLRAADFHPYSAVDLLDFAEKSLEQAL